jgi:outer membrane lipoprotein-sorting protein
MSGLDNGHDAIQRLEQLGKITPSEKSTQRAMRRVRESLRSRPPKSVDRSRRRFTLLSLSSAASIVVALGIVMFAYWLSDPSAAVAFEEVQQKLADVSSVMFSMTLAEGNDKYKAQVKVLGNNQLRADHSDGRIAIIDRKKKKMLLLDSQAKTAKVYQGFVPPDFDLYARIQDIRNESASTLPDRTIDGVRLNGFLLRHDYKEWKVWVDAKTKLPYRCESSRKLPNGGRSDEVFAEFVYDKRYDRSLFALTPPPGYTMDGTFKAPQPPSPKQLAAEKALVITPQVGFGPAKFGMTQEEVIEVLGQPHAIKPTARGKTTSLDYRTRGFSIIVDRQDGFMTLSCQEHSKAAFYARSFKGQTDKGIRLGDSRDDIVEAYGAPDSEAAKRKGYKGDGNMLMYYASGMQFSLMKNRVTMIMAHVRK